MRGDAEWTVACLGDRLRHLAPGMAGGGEGGPGSFSICGEAVPQPKLSHTVPAGGEVSLDLPGGGGFGPPEERDRELVEADLRDGRITGWPVPLSAPAGRRGDTAGVSQEEYLLANQPSELGRLQLQAQVWEPSGRQLLSKIDSGVGARALDVGCGAMGWLRILCEWVGPSGQVVGTDIAQSLLDAARSFLEVEGISNVELVVDDLFDSKLEPQSFDLVHARYQIAPLGRGLEQVASHQRLVRPGGSLVLEEWDLASWHFNPPAPAAERLIRLVSEIFASLGGEAGRGLPALLREIGVEEPEIDAHVIALKPGHPYLRLPLQFSAALESRLLETLSEDELASLRREADTELAEPGRWGTTFTLIQCWGALPG